MEFTLTPCRGATRASHGDCVLTHPNGAQVADRNRCAPPGTAEAPRVLQTLMSELRFQTHTALRAATSERAQAAVSCRGHTPTPSLIIALLPISSHPLAHPHPALSTQETQFTLLSGSRLDQGPRPWRWGSVLSPHETYF